MNSLVLKRMRNVVLASLCSVQFVGCGVPASSDSGSLLAQSQMTNDSLYKSFARVESTVHESRKVDGLSAATIAELYAGLVRNPVSSLSVLAKYDPTGAIGFCYGRAVSAHLTAARFGLKTSSIKKLFMVGDMRSNPAKREWRFHVTTIVRNDSGEWIALDPIMNEYPFSYNGRPQPGYAAGPMPVEHWISNVRKVWDNWQTDGSGHRVAKAKLFIAPAAAVLPDIRIVYASPNQEPGDRLIQLSFEPLAHAGIAASTIASEAFDLDVESAREFFLSVDEPAADRFDMLGMSFTKRNPPNSPQPISLSYNGYFADLLRFFESATLDQIKNPVGFHLLTPESSAPAGALTDVGLGSIRFDLL